MGRRFGSKNGMGTGSTRMSRHTGSGRYGSGGRKSSIHVPARPFWTTKKWKKKPLSAKIFDIVIMLAGLAIILVVAMFLVNGTKNGNNNNENVTSVYSSNSKKKKDSSSKNKNEGTEGTKENEEGNTDTIKSRTTDSSLSREKSIAREESIGRSHRENKDDNTENNDNDIQDTYSFSGTLQKSSTPSNSARTPYTEDGEYPKSTQQQQQSNWSSLTPHSSQNNAPQPISPQ
ncbi:hypothetical protein CBG04_09880 [Limosilactobacillus reuteri]|uniref:hypothetical protein n=1 Tax=Limosilactobacillus reuteri TaxID=1598 RepID=UPI000B98C23A|nr:hypothetical protein [Limosilactobacillus reuteri]OYS80623.1 hypothetical protein CBG11_07310 [Limosilactobacillus reuteri]OYS81392.1 hypothetical protein CBG04_09880 [Limosilactobacillus reuteri]OYS83711.1 hypothetical protein CBG14_07230 [Limosilactobacillus reuteri]